MNQPLVSCLVSACLDVLHEDAVTLSFDDATSAATFLSLDLRFTANSSVTVTVQTNNRIVYRVVYICTERILTTAAKTGDGTIVYGIGALSGRRRWSSISRDVEVDVIKGASARPTRRRPTATYARMRRKEFFMRQQQRTDDADDRRKPMHDGKTAGKRQRRDARGPQKTEAAGWKMRDAKRSYAEKFDETTKMVRRVVSVELRGEGYFDNLTLTSTPPHVRMFLRSADWFVRQQDRRGGWSVPVKRRLAAGRLRLAPGWYSAMAQGQAMSVLTRAYALTGDRRYLDCARRATALFDVPSTDGGVLASLFNLPWYEEYPTVPGTFVLNGFIYALVGL